MNWDIDLLLFSVLQFGQASVVKMKIKMPNLRDSGFKIIVLFALQQRGPGCVKGEARANMYFGVANKSATEDSS